MSRGIRPLYFYLTLGLCLALAAGTAVFAARSVTLSRQADGLRRQNASIVSGLRDTGSRYAELQSAVEAEKTAVPAKTAYLTFDDGPSSMTPRLLEALRGCGVHGTFFIVGINAQNNPSYLKDITDGGNALGIHSWTHQYDVIYTGTDAFLSDFNKLKDYIFRQTGIAPDICRFPGGTNNTKSYHYDKHIMQQIVPLVDKMGIRHFDWNVDSEDASNPVPTKEQITKTVLGECAGKQNAVILFHDAAQHQSTVDALPGIVASLKAQGYRFGVLTSVSPSCQFAPS